MTYYLVYSDFEDFTPGLFTKFEDAMSEARRVLDLVDSDCGIVIFDEGQYIVKNDNSYIWRFSCGDDFFVIIEPVELDTAIKVETYDYDDE